MQALDEVADLLRVLGVDLAVDAENAAVYFRVWPEQGGSPHWEDTADTFVVHCCPEEYWIFVEPFPGFVTESGDLSKELVCALLGLNDTSKMAKFAIRADRTAIFVADLRREDLSEGLLMDTIQVMRHILRERLPSIQKAHGLARAETDR